MLSGIKGCIATLPKKGWEGEGDFPGNYNFKSQLLLWTTKHCYSNNCFSVATFCISLNTSKTDTLVNTQKMITTLCTLYIVCLNPVNFNLKSHGYRAFAVSAPDLWNSLPNCIHSCDNLSTFKVQTFAGILLCSPGKNSYAQHFKGKHGKLYIVGKLNKCRFQKKI